METFLFKPVEYARMYNCSWYLVEAVPLEERRHPRLGAGLIALAAAYTLCYAPCAMAMARHLEHSCYKLMFALACCDLVALVNIGVFVGYIAVEGMVFCSAPTFMLLTGTMCFFGWLVASTLALLLALNRYVELSVPRIAWVLFSGKHTWLWALAALCYAGIGVTFSPAFSFSSILFSCFTNPHAGYYPQWYQDETYHNHLQPVHNALVVIFTPTLYAFMLFGLLCKNRRAKNAAIAAVTPAVNNTGLASLPPTIPISPSQPAKTTNIVNSNNSEWENRIILQVVLISAVNAVSCAIFTSFQFFATPPWMVYLGTYAWVTTHGLPSVVYLIFNQTIRNDSKEMLVGMVTKLRTSFTMRACSEC